MPWSARTKTSRSARTSSGMSRWSWRSAFPSTLSKISQGKQGRSRIAKKAEEGIRPTSHHLPDGALGEFSCLLSRQALDDHWSSLHHSGRAIDARSGHLARPVRAAALAHILSGSRLVGRGGGAK